MTLRCLVCDLPRSHVLGHATDECPYGEGLDGPEVAAVACLMSDGTHGPALAGEDLCGPCSRRRDEADV